MEARGILLLIFLALPYLFACFSFVFLSKQGNFRLVELGLGLARFICLLLLMNFLQNNGDLSLQIPFLRAFDIHFGFFISKNVLPALSVVEVVFLFIYMVFSSLPPLRSVRSALLMTIQGSMSVFLLSSSPIFLTVAQILMALCLYFLIKFSTNIEGKEWDAELIPGIAEKILLMQITVALLFLFWAVGSSIKKIPIDVLNASGVKDIYIWLMGFFLVIPLAPWHVWFDRALLKLPESISAIIILLMSCVLYQYVAIASPMLFLIEKYKYFFIVLGFFSCFLSLYALFKRKSKKEIFACVLRFYFGLILIALGLHSPAALQGATFLCLLLPISSCIMFYVSLTHVISIKHYILIALFMAFLWAVPGTPLFKIFDIMISRSIELGGAFAIAFGALWFLYFSANVYVCRKIFLTEEITDFSDGKSVAPSIQSGLVFYAGFLLFFIGTLILML